MENRWPLLELRVSRLQCIEWMLRHGYPRPPKSSCIFCPYHDDALWAEIKKNPAEWEEACEMDERIRNIRRRQAQGPGHLSAPLADQPLREAELRPGEPDLFDEKGFPVECEGMCGL
jgi:hypothetical protein